MTYKETACLWEGTPPQKIQQQTPTDLSQPQPVRKQAPRPLPRIAHRLKERGADCYETAPCAVEALLAVENLAGRIWEPACGSGSIVRTLRGPGHRVLATQLHR